MASGANGAGSGDRQRSPERPERVIHPPPIQLGRYRASLASSEGELSEARALRSLCFATAAPDADAFDSRCDHLLVRAADGGTLVACFRLLRLGGGAQIADSYSAQFYDLSALAAFPGRVAEVGRFCIRPGWPDPDILRLAWGALARIVDQDGLSLLFGCSSFAGTRAEDYLDVFAMLKARHLAPARWRPGVRAAEVFRYAARLRRRPDQKAALARMPPLLRTYLAMGGWVSDHAVIDRKMNTLHVFTGLEIGAIPPARARALRAVAALAV